ncbi:MAG: hypothetical protein K1X83_11065 [Oligoflexia bacterium]|nr:hypothetical protein [Oligoflexia bacterium]
MAPHTFDDSRYPAEKLTPVVAGKDMHLAAVVQGLCRKHGSFKEVGVGLYFGDLQVEVDDYLVDLSCRIEVYTLKDNSAWIHVLKRLPAKPADWRDVYKQWDPELGEPVSTSAASPESELEEQDEVFEVVEAMPYERSRRGMGNKYSYFDGQYYELVAERLVNVNGAGNLQLDVALADEVLGRVQKHLQQQERPEDLRFVLPGLAELGGDIPVVLVDFQLAGAAESLAALGLERPAGLEVPDMLTCLKRMHGGAMPAEHLAAIDSAKTPVPEKDRTRAREALYFSLLGLKEAELNLDATRREMLEKLLSVLAPTNRVDLT